MKIMQHIVTYSALTLMFCLVIQSCAQQASKPSSVIAAKNGYELTENHLALFIEATEDYSVETGIEQKADEIKEELTQAFLEDPKGMLSELNALAQISEEPQDTMGQENTNKPKIVTTSLAEGNRVVRKVVGNDIGQMQFDTKAANEFRAFIANSLLYAGSSRGDGGGGMSAENKTQFCADGSYTEYRSAYLSITVPGMDASSYDEDHIPGYWEVASLPNGMMVILLYSTHPLMLEDSPNGFLPFPVAQYSEDFVALPNGDGYRRSINYCN